MRTIERIPVMFAFFLAATVVCPAAQADEKRQPTKQYRMIFNREGLAVCRDAGDDLKFRVIEQVFQNHVTLKLAQRSAKSRTVTALEIDVVTAQRAGNVRKAQATVRNRVTGVSLKAARICVTGFDHNRPDDFPGLGDFIGWTSGAVPLANGELLFVHSAGYWHVSFATPVVLSDDLIEPYEKMGLDLNHKAPTGGRIMACRSTDNGKTWSKPFTIYDGPLDDRPSAAFVGNYYGEMSPAFLRLSDGRLLLTFTVRALRPPLGVHAVLGKEFRDGFKFNFEQDRIVIDRQTPVGKPSGGGFGPTVQLDDGTLVTSYSYRTADNQTQLEVARWRLPKQIQPAR